MAGQPGGAKELCGYRLWSDHTRRAKRRMLAVRNAKTAAKRTSAYRDLLEEARETAGCAEGTVQAVGRGPARDAKAQPRDGAGAAGTRAGDTPEPEQPSRGNAGPPPPRG